jgi:serine/threonine protein kinase
MVPPDLPGFTHIRLLGSGGYSDVFLYEQQMPHRQVAIKVLLAEALGDQGRQQFFAEANAMAAVSTHPFIVSVFHAELSAGGHPYLVMEYYPRDNFSVRSRTEQIPVSEVLRVGVQVGSAVETAHRAGILHRDIKPANILTSEYDRPGLTDFGIATASTGGVEAEGMSIPWSPPEVVNGSAPGDATADVYSLAATLYTLLSGRSPFEVPGGSNRTFDLVPRIERGGPRPTGRDDVPESLERLLRHGMSRSAADRPPSALQFARMLQAVEVEQGWAATQLEIRQDPRDVRSRSEPPDEDGTRLKGPTIIQPQPDRGSGPPVMVTGAPGASGRLGSSTSDDLVEGTVARGAAPASGASGLVSGVGARPVGLSGRGAPRPVQPMPSSAVRSAQPPSAEVADAAGDDLGGHGGGRSPVGRLKIGAAGVLAVVALVLLAMAFSGEGDRCEEGSSDPECATAPDTDAPPIAPPVLVGAVTDVEVVDNGDGTDTVAWSYAGHDESVEYTLSAAGSEGYVEGVSMWTGNLLSVEDAADAEGNPTVRVTAVLSHQAYCWDVVAHVTTAVEGTTKTANSPPEQGCRA